jgi:hypothetical protein
MVAIGFRLEVDQPVAVLRLRAVVRREDVGRDEPWQAPDTYLEVNPNGRICLKIFPPTPYPHPNPCPKQSETLQIWEHVQTTKSFLGFGKCWKNEFNVEEYFSGRIGFVNTDLSLSASCRRGVLGGKLPTYIFNGSMERKFLSKRRRSSVESTRKRLRARARESPCVLEQQMAMATTSMHYDALSYILAR